MNNIHHNTTLPGWYASVRGEVSTSQKSAVKERRYAQFITDVW